jgi:hypothetical protein
MIHIHAIKTLGQNEDRAVFRALPAPAGAGQLFDSIIRLYNDEDHIIDLEQAMNQVLGLSTDKETKIFYWYKVDLESEFQYSAFIAVKSLSEADHNWAKQEARYRRWTSVGACTR